MLPSSVVIADGMPWRANSSMDWVGTAPLAAPSCVVSAAGRVVSARRTRRVPSGEFFREVQHWRDPRRHRQRRRIAIRREGKRLPRGPRSPPVARLQPAEPVGPDADDSDG
jgi:hypothetical protein